MRVLAALGLLSGCIENEVSAPGKDRSGEDVPQIEVMPIALEYDALPLDASDVRIVTITNIGLAPLTIAGARIGGTTAFSLPIAPSAVLQPNEEFELSVVFSPVNPEDEGSLTISSDDPEVPSVEVPLSGTALVGELLVLPDPLNFGEVPLGCSQSSAVHLQNVGSVDLTINAIVPLGADFGANWDFDLPLVIAAGEQVDVPVWYTPDDLVEDFGEVWISTDGIISTTIANQSGSGTDASSANDEWWQGNGPWEKTDILFYVDQSLSMTDDKARLTSNFSRFIGILESLELDWQVMVVTDEDGCHNESILDRDSVGADAQFASAVDGPWGRYTEAGLTLATLALAQADTGCNTGFLRDESKTTVVLVSDEPEQSRAPVADYVAEMRSYAENVSITSIVGDVPDGCETAAPGTGYVDASIATGGARLSICNEDWSSYFETIAALSALGQTDTFVLSSLPDPATIAVEVSGVPSTAWTYDALWNAIVFERASVPAPGVQITADYRISADCEE